MKAATNAYFVVFNFDPQRGISKAHTVTLSGSEHGDVGLPTNLAVFWDYWSIRFLHMCKALFAQCIYDLLGLRVVDDASCQPIPSGDVPASVNVHKLHGLDVAGLESDSRACCYVQSLSICLSAVERERRVRLDEMVMGSDLAWMLVKVEE